MPDMQGYRYGGSHTTSGKPIGAARVGRLVTLRFADATSGFVEELHLHLASAEQARVFVKAAREVGAEPLP